MPMEVVGFCDCGRQGTATTVVTEQGMYVSEYRGKSWDLLECWLKRQIASVLGVVGAGLGYTVILTEQASL